jgi:hypothetical protein
MGDIIYRQDAFPKGVDNTSSETKMPRDPNTGKPVAMREGENIDLSSSGVPRRREGYQQIATGTMHSGWSDDHFPFGLLVMDNVLQSFSPNEGLTPLQPDMAEGQPVSYARINDAVSWTNIVQCGQVTIDGVVRPWACPNPAVAPMLTATVDGALNPGEYQVALTFLDQWGRESGATRAIAITLTTIGGIAVEDLPQPPAGGRIRVYMTGGNNGDLRAAATLAEGETDALLAQLPNGRPCDTSFLVPMPAGQLVAYGNGRQFVARNREVLYSPSLRYGLFDPRGGRVGFTKRVQMMAFVGDGSDGAGLFVSDTKRTYFLAGSDPANWAQRIAYGYAALPGQLGWAPGSIWGLETDQLLPVWQATDGRLCVGMPGGTVMTPASGAAMDIGNQTSILYRPEDGEHRIVAAMRGAGTNHLAVRDKMIVREYRHET